MGSIPLSRTIDVPPAEVRALVADLEPFVRAAGFDDVTVDEDRMAIENRSAIARIELKRRLVDDPEAELAYQQVDGVFEEMYTAYELTAAEAGTKVTATTGFALDPGVVGGVLHATVIKRQRTRELCSQFDHLEAETNG